jgi:hypothetical protein
MRCGDRPIGVCRSSRSGSRGQGPDAPPANRRGPCRDGMFGDAAGCARGITAQIPSSRQSEDQAPQRLALWGLFFVAPRAVSNAMCAAHGSTPGLSSLLRRALLRPVRTEHAAVAILRMEQTTAALASVEVHARIRGHRLDLGEATMRASDRGAEDWHGLPSGGRREGNAHHSRDLPPAGRILFRRRQDFRVTVAI